MWFFHTLVYHCERKTSHVFTTCWSVKPVLNVESFSWYSLMNLSALDNITFNGCSKEICMSCLSASLKGGHWLRFYKCFCGCPLRLYLLWVKLTLGSCLAVRKLDFFFFFKFWIFSELSMSYVNFTVSKISVSVYLVLQLLVWGK